MDDTKRMKLHLVGLGTGSYRDLTMGTVELLQSGIPVILRTAVHPTVPWLDAEGILYSSCDDLYEGAEDFQDLYDQIAQRVLGELKQYSEVIYGVPGHPLLAEKPSAILLQLQEEQGYEVCLHPAISALESIAATLALDLSGGVIIQDALDYQLVAGSLPQLILQGYNRRVVGELKLTLLESYPPETLVTVVQAARVPEQEQLIEVALGEIDHLTWIDHLTSFYIPSGNTLHASFFPLDPLIKITHKLRSPEGCPWDQEQDHRSLSRYCLEEAIEVIAAIEKADYQQLVDELGDLMLQIALHACIAAEESHFDVNDVVEGICNKMIRRHPHVFGETQVADAEEVRANWEEIKRAERGASSATLSILQEVGEGMPALTRARKIQERAAGVGFDWPDVSGVLEKKHEEMQELEAAVANRDIEGIISEFGDLLFTMVNWSRFLKIDPELALIRSCEKFKQRFSVIEKESAALGKNLVSMTLHEMEALWERSKSKATVS